MVQTGLITRPVPKNRRAPYLLVLLGREYLWKKYTILVVSIKQEVIANVCFRSKIEFIELCFTSFFFLLLNIPFGGGDCGGETSKFNPMSLSGGSVARIRS